MCIVSWIQTETKLNNISLLRSCKLCHVLDTLCNMSQHCSSNEGFPLIRYLSTSIGKLIALFSFNNQSKHEMRKSVSSRNFWLRKLLNEILDNFDWERRIFCPFTRQFTMKIFFDRWMKVCTGLVNTLGGWLISDPGLVEAQYSIFVISLKFSIVNLPNTN